MRHLVLLSMMALASAQANAETCVLRTPLKAARAANLSRWESLPAGTELSVVLRKTDWTRVLRDNAMHVVATTQLAAACVAKAEEPKAAAAPVAAAPVAAAKAEEPKAAAATPVAAAKAEEPKAAAAPVAAAPAAAVLAKAEEPAKVEPAKVEPAKAEEPAKAKLSLSPAPSSTTPGQLLVIGGLLLGVVATAAFLRRRTVVEQQHLDVVATRTLGRGKQLVVVDAGDARLLLGVTEQGITVLSSSSPHAGHQAAEAAAFAPSSTSSFAPKKPALSLLTAEEEAATSTTAAALFKGLGNKVNGLWGRPPSGPPSDWDSFDRILASTVPEGTGAGPTADAAPSNSRRPAERTSSVTGSADLAELTRELQRHGVRRSA